MKASSDQSLSSLGGGTSRAAQGGFTLVELMIVVVITAILIVIAAPSYSELILSNKLKTYANEIVTSVYLARGEAIKRNSIMTMCASANGISCIGSGDWDQGWIVLDPNSTVIKRMPELAGGFVLTDTLASAHTMIFQPSGVSGTQASFTACRKTPTVGGQKRVITVSATGKPSVARSGASTCP
ncbi:MAG: GspH/FimT family pseudopilin [Halioglobus sp.]